MGSGVGAKDLVNFVYTSYQMSWDRNSKRIALVVEARRVSYR